MDIKMGFVDLVWEDIRINEISCEEHGVFYHKKWWHHGDLMGCQGDL
jgi:hypothetical protein